MIVGNENTDDFRSGYWHPDSFPSGTLSSAHGRSYYAVRAFFSDPIERFRPGLFFTMTRVVTPRDCRRCGSTGRNHVRGRTLRKIALQARFKDVQEEARSVMPVRSPTALDSSLLPLVRLFPRPSGIISSHIAGVFY
jgi:hypothetical protein